MSDTVKLIIEIPRNEYEYTCERTLSDRTFWDEAIRNGIQLDDMLDKIIAEIDEKSSHYEHFSSSNTANGLMIAKRIVGKYKTESEDI